MLYTNIIIILIPILLLLLIIILVNLVILKHVIKYNSLHDYSGWLDARLTSAKKAI
jgi:hypothetical protein